MINPTTRWLRAILTFLVISIVAAFVLTLLYSGTLYRDVNFSNLFRINPLLLHSNPSVVPKFVNLWLFVADCLGVGFFLSMITYLFDGIRVYRTNYPRDGHIKPSQLDNEAPKTRIYRIDMKFGHFLGKIDGIYYFSKVIGLLKDNLKKNIWRVEDDMLGPGIYWVDHQLAHYFAEDKLYAYFKQVVGLNDKEVVKRVQRKD